MPDAEAVRMRTYAEAVNLALDEALTASSGVLLFGEDVATPGGVFGVTKGLKRKHGDRVFDTPISESAILGGAVGAAMLGMRPIAEIMWVDFSLVALDQIVNQAANVRYVNVTYQGAFRKVHLETADGAVLTARESIGHATPWGIGDDVVAVWDADDAVLLAGGVR